MKFITKVKVLFFLLHVYAVTVHYVMCIRNVQKTVDISDADAQYQINTYARYTYMRLAKAYGFI